MRGEMTWIPCYWPRIEAKFYGGRFVRDPDTIVIHSGSKSDNVAEYFVNPWDPIQKKYIKRSAHLSWSRGVGNIVQSVPLSHIAYHAGGSIFQGRGLVNYRSIGIELPGPWDQTRSAAQLERLKRTIAVLLTCINTLKYVIRHSDIDPKKTDPGPGFYWECLDGLGLEFPYR
jgi:N-acetyl-anhydromuramyl-L-alanine amidase AmpD